ncbi:hypothetical protein Tsubulata_042403, partial [Turnera subulata]
QKIKTNEFPFPFHNTTRTQDSTNPPCHPRLQRHRRALSIPDFVFFRIDIGVGFILFDIGVVPNCSGPELCPQPLLLFPSNNNKGIVSALKY